jgi:hypothetical protein
MGGVYPVPESQCRSDLNFRHECQIQTDRVAIGTFMLSVSEGP